jgi:2-dehydropantoate 2-reductase
MKIAVIGAGAMGCLYGGKLSAIESNQVYLLDVWKEHVDTINEKGLWMEEKGERLHYPRVKASLDPKEVGPVDLAIVFVKSTMTEKAVMESSALFGPATWILTLQNGLGNIEKIGEIAGLDNVLGGTTAHGAYMKGPGEICHAGFGKTIIGEINGEETPRIRELHELLGNADLETEISRNILGLIWDKLIVNVGINPLTAITSLTNGELLQHPELLNIMERAVAEAVSVAEAKGIRLSYDDPFAHVKQVCHGTSANKSSMLQDILNHRKTEIDRINGAVWLEGDSSKVETPVNQVLTELVRYLEKRKAPPVQEA